MIAPGKHRSVAGRVLAVGCLLAALPFAGSFLLPARAAFADTITVTNTADPGDGDCNPGGGCTLREAINEANATTADTIRFDIPGAEVKTIKPRSELPNITEPLTIDGYSQPGADPNTLTTGTNADLKIELNGEDAGKTSHALFIRASDCVVKGLAINRFGSNAINIGGPGVEIRDNRVAGNFIGTDPSGNPDVGNDGRGVVIFSSSLGNSSNTSNTVGGSRPAGRNLISGNALGGVGIFEATDNAIIGNLIGTAKNGTDELGNSGGGVRIFGGFGKATGNVVGGTLPETANTIAFNGESGVQIVDDASTGNGILRNSIFSNDGIGIDLGDDGATSNDEDDPDDGPNRLQNKPRLTSAENAGGETTVEGKLNSSPNKTFRIRFFSNPSGSEGKKYLGAKTVSSASNGEASFTFEPENKVPLGRRLTATATRTTTADTSEFSDAEVVIAD